MHMKLARTSLVELTHLSAIEIADRVREGDVTAVEVVDAHIRRIEDVDRHLNAVVVRRFEAARVEAAAIDAAVARGETVGPLAGVPTTIKECYHVAGTPSTMGLPSLAHDLATDDSPLVARLKAAGAIILGKTNVPQLMLMHETDNPLYGRTLNPWNARRSPGGSSGGEAAIIAACGSALGLAGDLGGSIRQPAHACGIHGLKSTSGRLTNAGGLSGFNGLEAMTVDTGPMARSVADLAVAYEVLAAPGLDAIDCRVSPVPTRDPAAVELRGLRIAMWTHDGCFRPSPAIRRAVEEAAGALRARGAIVESFAPPHVEEAMRVYFRLMSADGGAGARRLRGNDPPQEQVRKLARLGRLPRRWRPALARMLDLMGQSATATLLRCTGPSTAADVWQLTRERDDWVAKFMAALDIGRYDAMLCPPHALPALTHGSFIHVPMAASYSMMFNLLGVPAGVVAATRVRPGEESDRRASRDWVERAALAVEADSAGLPIGVQVAARHWREDVVLAVMQALEDHFSDQPDYPTFPG